MAGDSRRRATSGPCASYELVEHTADVGIRAWGPSLPDAFEQAVWGLVDVLGAHADRADETRTISLGAGSDETVVVGLLNELIALREQVYDGTYKYQIAEGTLDVGEYLARLEEIKPETEAFRRRQQEAAERAPVP